MSLAIIILVSVSCRSVEVVGSSEVKDVQKFSVARSVDTIYLHDSVFVREVMRGDTVYLTRTEWRDRWRTRVVHDTVRHTEYVDRVVEKPPERYVPKFYKRCTIALWAIVAIATIVVIGRFAIGRRKRL
jgi:hypothetical protein